MEHNDGLTLEEIYLKILSDKKIARENEIALIIENNDKKEIHRRFINENFTNLTHSSSSAAAGGSRKITINTDLLWSDGSNMLWSNNVNISNT